MTVSRRVVLAVALAAVTTSVPRIASAGTLAEVRARGRIRVGTEAAFEPFEFLQDGVIVGYGRELLDAVVARLGVTLEQQNLPFQGLLPGLLAKKFDLIATTLGINEERTKRFAFTRPFAALQAVVLVNRDNTRISRMEDLNAKTAVGVQLGSNPARVLDKWRADALQASQPVPEVRQLQSTPDCGVALSNRQVDAIVVPSNFLSIFKRVHGNAFSELVRLGTPTLACWATHPEDTTLRDFINETFAELQRIGRLDALQLKWLGYRSELPSSGYLPPGSV